MRHNGRAPLQASTVRPDLMNLRDGETRTIVCPDCSTWRPIQDRMVIAHRAEPHSGQSQHRRSEPDRRPRCAGSGQRIWFDITPDQWLARYEKLTNRRQNEAMNPGSRHTTRVKRLGSSPAPIVVPRRRKAEWAAVSEAVSVTDAARKNVPGGDRPRDGSGLPLAPQDVTAHDRRQAELGRHARNGRLAKGDPVQPECANCGTTELNFVRAAAAGWRQVLRRTHCGRCAGRFPAWMRTQF
ncbi:hypothetical protein AB0469_35150 [Streptomyces sp. NPDC093801]|uniref:hypothetical protein n=1 Tax=Streptomyces sp. NPDC093801 TaxID=3155203 RepID=UPI00344F27FC